jgi:hypothetical protein
MEHAVACVNQALQRGWRSSLATTLLRPSLPALPASAWATNAEIAHALSPVPMKSSEQAANLLQSYTKPDFNYSPAARALHSDFTQNLLVVSRVALPASVLLEAVTAAASGGASRTAPLWLKALLSAAASRPESLPQSDILRLREAVFACLAASASTSTVDEAAAALPVALRMAAATGGNLSRDELRSLLRLCAGGVSLHRRRQAVWKGYAPVQSVMSSAAAADKGTRVALMRQLLIHGHSSGCINAADLPILQLQAAEHAVSLGAPVAALDLLRLPGAANASVPPSPGLFSRLIGSEVGSKSPHTQWYLQLMQQHGVSPTPDTLHALLRVRLHSGSPADSHGGAARAADILQACSDELGVPPGERSLGYAAFHAAKYGQWGAVQGIRTLARKVRAEAGRAGGTSRWESKLALYGRLHTKKA